MLERFMDNRDMPLPDPDDAVACMRYNLQGKDGKAIYAQRKCTVEPVFGIIKNVLGFRQFSMRGLKKAQGEWQLVCMAWNIAGTTYRARMAKRFMPNVNGGWNLSLASSRTCLGSGKKFIVDPIVNT